MAQTFTVYLLWFSAIFDPIGSLYGFRYAALASVFIFISYSALLGRIRLRACSVYFKYLLLFSFFLPFYGLIISLVRGGVGGDSFKDTSYFASAVYYASTLSFIGSGDIRSSIKAFLFSTRVLCLVIISCAFVSLITFSLDYPYFFVRHGAAYIGIRQYGGLSLSYVYFVASPMLIILLSHESWKVLEKRSFINIISFLIAITAYFLSGTRSSMIVAVCTLPIIIMYKHRSFRAVTITVIGVIFAAIIFYVNYDDAIADMLSSNEYSNNIKLTYIDQYLEIFNNPSMFLFGQGFNANEWSVEFSNMLIGEASKTELTYLELIRVFGVIGSIFFYLGMFYFFNFTNRILPEYRWIFVGLALYLLVSSSNPYLFSSNGMLVIGLAACVVSQQLSRVNLPYKSTIH